MPRTTSRINTPVCIVAGGVGLLFCCSAYRRWRSSHSHSHSSSSSSAQCCPQTNQTNQNKQNNPQGDGPTELSRATRAVPVEVIASELPAGWRAAPVVFQPPTMAVLPLVPPSGGDCFIVCEGPLPKVEDGASFFLHYLQNQTLFNIVAVNGASVVPLDKMGLSCESQCFTHIIVNPDEEMGIVLGRNGPYILSLVITEFKLISDEKEKDNTSKSNLKLSDLQMLLNACRLVPLVDEFRFPDTPVGVGEGRLRVTCSSSNYIVVFAVPTTISVKSVLNENCKSNNNNNGEPLFVLEGDVLPDGKITVDASAIDSVVKGVTIDTLFPIKNAECLPVSSFLSLVSVQDLVHRAPNDDTNGNGNKTDSSTTENLLSKKNNNNKDGKEEEDRVNVAFSHFPLGVSFSVNPHGGIVREPILTDDLLLFYYPLGDEGIPASQEITSESVVVPPCAEIRRLSQIPPTWEKYLATDDELKHNVLFHFTDWVNERVSSSICELNGIRCVQMNEEKEDHSCRSYIVPFAHGILVVRWETKSSEWDLHLPHLQQFLDTLHLVEPTV